jgi:hypothetical protein
MEPPSGDPNAPEREQRLSMLAVLALLGVFASIFLGIGGIVGTLMGWPVTWAVLVGPIMALVSSVAAFVSLRKILTSGGVLMGRFAATLALFVGLGITTLTGFAALAAMLTLSSSKNLAPIVEDAAIGAQDVRMTLATRGLSTAAKEDLSRERLALFGELLMRELGDVTGASADMSLLVEARNVMADSPYAEFVDPEAFALEDAPRPVWLEYTDAAGNPAKVIAYVSLDLFDREAELRAVEPRSERGAGGGERSEEGDELAPGDGGEGGVRSYDDARVAAVIVSDIAVVVGPNRVVLLREDGPSSRIAELLGWDVVAE